MKDRTPVLVSAFVYPGGGQFLQKRKLAGTLYALVFTLFLVILFYEVLRPLVANVNAALDWAAEGKNEEFRQISFAGVLLTFLAALITYIMNLVDVTRAQRTKAPHPPPLP